jgi:hypothetical protein
MPGARVTALLQALPHPVRWLVVGTVGGLLVVLGLVLMVLPGPGIPVLLLGLVVLATEFAWAEALLRRAKQGGSAVMDTIRRRPRA